MHQVPRSELLASLKVLISSAAGSANGHENAASQALELIRNDKYSAVVDEDPRLSRDLYDLASDLSWSNGNAAEMWGDFVALVTKLSVSD